MAKWHRRCNYDSPRLLPDRRRPGGSSDYYLKFKKRQRGELPTEPPPARLYHDYEDGDYGEEEYDYDVGTTALAAATTTTTTRRPADILRSNAIRTWKVKPNSAAATRPPAAPPAASPSPSPPAPVRDAGFRPPGRPAFVRPFKSNHPPPPPPPPPDLPSRRDDFGGAATEADKMDRLRDFLRSGSHGNDPSKIAAVLKNLRAEQADEEKDAARKIFQKYGKKKRKSELPPIPTAATAAATTTTAAAGRELGRTKSFEPTR